MRSGERAESGERYLLVVRLQLDDADSDEEDDESKPLHPTEHPPQNDDGEDGRREDLQLVCHLPTGTTTTASLSASELWL